MRWRLKVLRSSSLWFSPFQSFPISCERMGEALTECHDKHSNWPFPTDFVSFVQVCTRIWRPSRLESECIYGEGLTFLFPDSNCNPFGKKDLLGKESFFPITTRKYLIWYIYKSFPSSNLFTNASLFILVYIGGHVWN